MKACCCLVIVLLGACVATTSTSTSGPSGPTGPTTSGQVTIPNVFKLPKERAIAELRRAGVQSDVSDDTSLCGSTVDGQVIELGEVCYQHPAAGQVQGARLPVTLRVQTEDPRQGNLGKVTEWRLMPNLAGKTFDEAVAEMKKLGFSDTRIKQTTAEDAGCAAGVVCKSYPEALQRAGINSDTVLYVGK